jgi:hypothetical protein
MLYDKRWDKKIETPALSPAAETLLKAADIIEEHGWCQYSTRKADGSVCLYGAIRRTAPHLAANGDAGRLLHRHLGINNYVEWNDVPGRTQAEVLKALRGAAFAT